MGSVFPRAGLWGGGWRTPIGCYTHGVHTSVLSVFLAVVFAVQTVLGGMAPGALICLGGEHRGEEIATADAGCEHECGHTLLAPAPPADGFDAHDDCGCVDLEIAPTETGVPPRTEAETSVVGDPTPDVSPQPSLLIARVAHARTVQWRRPGVPCSASGPHHEPGALVGVTRLNI